MTDRVSPLCENAGWHHERIELLCWIVTTVGLVISNTVKCLGFYCTLWCLHHRQIRLYFTVNYRCQIISKEFYMPYRQLFYL